MKKFNIKICIIILLILKLSFSYGIKKDSLKINIHSWQLENFYSDIINIKIDTSFNNFHIYNPIYKNSILGKNFLGNLGQAYFSKIFSENKKKKFFPFYDNFLNYFYKNEDFSYFHTNKPFTKFIYTSNGTKNRSEQLLDIIHTQNINKYWNVGLKSNFIASEGLYFNQKTQNFSIAFFSSFLKKNYEIHFNTFLNKYKLEESGGKMDGDDVITSYLEDAFTILNNKSLFLSQSFLIEKEDTIVINDSTKNLIYIPKGKIFHNFNIEKSHKSYKDKIEGNEFYKYNFLFFNDEYSDDGVNYDSTLFYSITNNFGYEFAKKKPLKKTPNFTKKIFLGHNYFTNLYYNSEEDFKSYNKFYNFYASLIFESEIIDSNFFKIKGKYFFDGYNKNDFDFNLKLKRQINKNNLFILDFFYEKKEAIYFYKYYISNHFWWKNNFKKQKNFFLNFTYKNVKNHFKIGSNISMLENHIYLDSVAHPEQFQEKFLIFEAFLEKNFFIYNFRFFNKIHFQHATNNEVLNIPKFVSYHSFFYENIFFKNVLKTRFGFDIRFNTSYYLPKYSPAISQFYLKYEEKSSYYPELNIFADFQIKRASIFLKYINILSFLEKNKFSVINYPLNESSFRVGVLWNFYN